MEGCLYVYVYLAGHKRASMQMQIKCNAMPLPAIPKPCELAPIAWIAPKMMAMLNEVV